ncbi:MAG: hypothetical protein ACTHK8_04015 [Ginsengibacter sp.]
MASYEDIKAMSSDVNKDKTSALLLRIFLGLLIVVFLITSVATLIRGYNDKPVNFLWGFYQNRPIDTVVKIVETKLHDTVFIQNETRPISKTKYLHDNTNVKSIDQKGGQTARDITNNN